MGAAEGNRTWTVPIGRKFQEWRRSRQFLFPVVEIVFQRRLVEPSTLLFDEVGILNGQIGQIGQGGRSARDPRLIDPIQFVEKNPEGKRVGGDVMHVHEQHVLGFRQSKERGAKREI